MNQKQWVAHIDFNWYSVYEIEPSEYDAETNNKATIKRSSNIQYAPATQYLHASSKSIHAFVRVCVCLYEEKLKVRFMEIVSTNSRIIIQPVCRTTKCKYRAVHCIHSRCCTWLPKLIVLCFQSTIDNFIQIQPKTKKRTLERYLKFPNGFFFTFPKMRRHHPNERLTKYPVYLICIYRECVIVYVSYCTGWMYTYTFKTLQKIG